MDKGRETSSAAAGAVEKEWLAKYGWVLPVLVAVLVYHVSVNNFFSFDDFIWLDRARMFNWQQLFRVDVTYFDPLVHLMFLTDAALAGVDPRWYHLVDLALHAANAVLVFSFALLLTGDARSALYSGTLFASSFAIADAVLWSSSRVDLLATFFSLCALVQFLHFVRGGLRQRLILSFVFFVLALGAKGTPLVLPVIFLWLILQERKPLTVARFLVPFAAVVFLYVLLLRLNMHQASLPLDKLHFNVRNLGLAFSSFFMSEQMLGNQNIAVVSIVLFAVVTSFALLLGESSDSAAMRRTGWFIMVTGLLPVLVLTDFKLLTVGSDPYLMLSSPSHRIYLASVGLALLGGGVLRWFEGGIRRIAGNVTPIAVATLLVLLVAVNAMFVRERDDVWQWVGELYRAGFNGLAGCRGKIPSGSQLALISFPGPNGFKTPMVRVCLGIDDVTLFKRVVLDVIDDRQILEKAELTYLLILGPDGKVHDKTKQFRRQLLLNRMGLQHPEHPEYLSGCKAVAENINRSIQQIFHL